MDYIDTSVFLATLLKEKEGRCCQEYLNIVGYKAKPKGTISHFVVSELFVALLTKTDSRQETGRSILFLLSEKMFGDFLDSGRLTIQKLKNNNELFLAVKEQDYALSEDDTFHLSAALEKGCDRFITLDKYLLTQERLKVWLKREHNLKIEHP